MTRYIRNNQRGLLRSLSRARNRKVSPIGAPTKQSLNEVFSDHASKGHGRDPHLSTEALMNSSCAALLFATRAYGSDQTGNECCDRSGVNGRATALDVGIKDIEGLQDSVVFGIAPLQALKFDIASLAKSDHFPVYLRLTIFIGRSLATEMIAVFPAADECADVLGKGDSFRQRWCGEAKEAK